MLAPETDVVRYHDFLSPDKTEETRKKLYELFTDVCGFVSRLNPASKINAVRLGGTCYWNSGEIAIPINTDGLGVIFHEVGHARLAQSVFHRQHLQSNANGNEKWGEPFSEAIRWLMEMKWLPGSKWLKSFHRDKDRLNSDKYRAELILRKGNHEMSGFDALWRSLVRDFDGSPDYLDRQLT